MSEPPPEPLPHDLQALLHAVEEGPDDDTLHVLADWLEENGQADRAELIHLHFDLTELPPDDPARPEFEARREAVQQRVAAEWLRGLCGGAGLDWRFERGVLASLTLEARAFADRAEEVCAHSGVPELRVVAVAPERAGPLDLPALVACPALARVSRLDLGGNYLGPEEAQALAESPYLTGLLALELEGNALGAEGAAALAGCRSLTRLRALGLAGNGIGDEGLRELLERARLPALAELDLSRNSLTNDGLAELAVSPLLGRLVVLNLSHNALGDGGAAVLALSPHLGRLRALDLGGNYISDGGLVALARCSGLAGLRALELVGNPFGAQGVRAWAGSPFIGALLGDRFRHLR
jgi:uncharacterized protein (TIGR02996 family)